MRWGLFDRRRAGRQGGSPVENVRFGAYEANFAIRELRKNGLRVRLPEQSFCALQVLIEAGDRPVSREELKRRLWGEEVHVNYDKSLNTVMHNLREALGDTAKNPRFVETVPGRGYRFVVPVAVDGGNEPAAWRGTLLAVAGGLLLFGFWYLYQARSGGEAGGIPELRPVTSYAGEEAGPSFSPTGAKVAFHWNGPRQENFDIYVKSVDGEDLRRLTSDPADERNPAWSPDGAHIAFLRQLPAHRTAIVLIPSKGGDARVLAVVPGTDSNLSWSSDGKWIAFSVSYPDYIQRAPERAGIQAVSVETGQVVQVTAPPARSLGDATPAFSPQGHKLAFLRMSTYLAGEFYVQELTADLRPVGRPERLRSGSAAALSPAWTPDGREIIFVSNRLGYSSLWRISAAGKGKPVPLGGEYAQDPVVAPGGSFLVYCREEQVSNLWALSLDGPGSAHRAPRQLTFSTKRLSNVAVSPDGQWIALESNSSGTPEIWVARADGSGLRRLTSFGGPTTGTPRWSPDGRFLAFDSRVQNQGEIFTVEVSTGALRQVTANPADDIVPSWSRDGRWIYFASNRSGRYQVWKAPPGGGGAVQVTRGGGFYAEESPDGKYVYYVKGLVETPLCRVPVDGGEETTLVESIPQWMNFSVNRAGIYLAAGPNPRRPILKLLDPGTGKTSTIARIDSELNGLDVSPDGRTLLFTKFEKRESDLFRMELR